MNQLTRVLLTAGYIISFVLCGRLACGQGIHKLWGTASAGGLNNDGSVFYVQHDGHGPLLQASMASSGISRAVGNLASYNKKLYGVSRYGGPSDKGALFEFDPYTNAIVKKVDFDGVSGGNPVSGLTSLYSRLYGVTFNGGATDKGVIYSFEPASGSYAKIRDFVDVSGSLPSAELLAVGDKFYGTTTRGGLYDAGVLFEFTPATNSYIVKANFNGSNGLSPCGNLVYYNNKIYGTTINAGDFGKGTLFQFDPATNDLTVLHQFIDAAHPQNGLLVYNGILYGVTTHGGIGDNGTLFSYNLSTGAFTKLVDFSSVLGISPNGIVEYNNKIYVVTGDLGSSSSGTVVEFDPGNGAVTRKADLDYVKTGAHPVFVNLSKIEAQTAPAIVGSCTTMPDVLIHAGNANQWVPVTDEMGNAVAEINANGNVLGVVQTSVYINGGIIREDASHKMYLDRNITINPQNAPTGAIGLRLYIRGQEYDKLKNAISSTGVPSGILSIDDIQVYRNFDPCSPVLMQLPVMVRNGGEAWAKEDYVFTTTITELSSFYFSTQTVVLPINLTSFEVQEQNSKALLKWTAIEDMNSSQYIIERSADGFAFTPVGSVKSTGGNGRQSYSWYDDDPLPENHYRLKLVVGKGNNGYSKIKKIIIKRLPLQVKVYDDASGTEIRVGIQSPNRQNVGYNIYNATGHLLIKGTLNLQPGRQVYTLPQRSVIPGVYHLLLTAGGIQKHVAFIRR